MHLNQYHCQKLKSHDSDLNKKFLAIHTKHSEQKTHTHTIKQTAVTSCRIIQSQ